MYCVVKLSKRAPVAPSDEVGIILSKHRNIEVADRLCKAENTKCEGLYEYGVINCYGFKSLKEGRILKRSEFTVNDMTCWFPIWQASLKGNKYLMKLIYEGVDYLDADTACIADNDPNHRIDLVHILMTIYQYTKANADLDCDHSVGICACGLKEWLEEVGKVNVS